VCSPQQTGFSVFFTFIPLNIILVGLPGSGKSTVGRQLARRWALPFVDSDQVIEQYLGCSIRDFFEREGEAKFRDIEEVTLDQLTQQTSPVVLSTGGGACMRAATRDFFHARGQVFYLHAMPDDIYRRIKFDTERPLLLVADPLQRLHDLYRQRDAQYRACAHYVIETGKSSVATLVNMMVMQLELAGVVPSGSVSSSD
jgi:shikimate kinase